MATRREQGSSSIRQDSTRPGRRIGKVIDVRKCGRVSRSTKTDVRAKLRDLTAETYNRRRLYMCHIRDAGASNGCEALARCECDHLDTAEVAAVQVCAARRDVNQPLER